MRTISSGIIALVLLVCLLTCQARTFRWKNPAGGALLDLVNLLTNFEIIPLNIALPGADDDVIIDLAGDFSVNIGGTANFKSLVVGSAASNATVIVGGALRVSEKSTVAGNGKLQVNSGGSLAANANGAFNIEGLLDVRGAAISAYTFINSTGRAVVSGASQLAANAVLEVSAGAKASFEASADFSMSAGSMLVARAGSEIRVAENAAIRVATGAVATVKAAGRFALASGAAVYAQVESTGETVVEAGQATFHNAVNFTANGYLTVSAGAEAVFNGLVNYGTEVAAASIAGAASAQVTVSAAAEFRVNNAINVATKFYAAGAVKVQQGMTAFKALAQFAASSVLAVASGASATFNADVEFNSNSDDSVSGSGSVVVTTNARWTGSGSWSGSGSTQVAANANMFVTGAKVVKQRTIDVIGTLYYNTTSAIEQAMVFGSNAKLAVRAEGRVVLQSKSKIAAENSGSSGSVESSGTVEVDTQAAADRVSILVAFVNNGVFRVKGAGEAVIASTYSHASAAAAMIINSKVTVDASAQLSLNAGFVKGTGTLAASAFVASGCTVAPGNSPGMFTVNGDFTLSSDSTMELEIAGKADTQHDQLVVSGKATILGTLLVKATDAYSATAGDSFVYLKASSVDSKPKAVSLSGNGSNGKSASAQATAIQGTITIATGPSSSASSLAFSCIALLVALVASMLFM